MFWKIYTVIYLLLIIVGTLFVVPSIGSWNFASWEGVIEGVLLAIGAFAFAYKKEWFNKETWKFIFIGILLVWIADIIFYTTNLQFLNFLKPNAIEHGVGTVLFSIVISIPALIAIYKTGFPKENS
ncbi:MAG: hypothetical protein UY61_C0038G0003 [Candidatus Adlerbacteria bacterium GW2011_GWC1_50_9]|uniref:Uncharacterized protein n=2 Tax=Parcubacteria group TaxID=1794811 RepID=A0A0G1YZ81_9BACT|nr:MAG: hypothetical protein UX06_C0013G0005 [Candidatus Giovannonibacteria bacterium GW2011_GWA2_45_21]KKW20307.1 MAG: hypothetical protein UY61_C0038G0003 [Candidatus Adlerbacteria bacterium GW2011_GWC1_50_9]